ncbi:stage II sporulation protein M [Chryseosolibacter indicus]|uniref:Stage II sporulation protein M n=1 Tax=Chryseosolibacter indicus TaxID=2782351 RepID=A0ABS5VSI5_9BACT|nr:stage II sporulation protein M [Chryseosolibacter indicus]MBT1704400.1 stage II sporulation protein M [Chryseosolibacter indicus]
MKEAAFVKQNKARWEEFERVVKGQETADPDRIAALFIQITDDLSFSRTQYNDSRTTQYLNALASKLHLRIYKNKREDKNRFLTFWKEEVPAAVYEARKSLLYSFIIFIVAGVIGAVSAYYDDTFVRLILGDGYVNMTLENIKDGKPTDVYASMDQTTMFFYITWNNVMVSFRVFVLGVIASLGTGFYLFYNGLMVGTFMTFFYQESQLSHALPVIMLHGTIELTSIVIAGAAGFTMGNSLIFPGTYSRLDSFKKGAAKGMKIVVGLVPFFFIAGFIESFVTRYAFMHWSLKALIILASAALMIYYFVIYPTLLKRNGKI